MRHNGLMAWPNIFAGRAVVPERVGAITPQQIADEAADWLAAPQRLQGQRADLQALRGQPGAVEALAEEIAREGNKCIKLEQILASREGEKGRRQLSLSEDVFEAPVAVRAAATGPLPRHQVSDKKFSVIPEPPSRSLARYATEKRNRERRNEKRASY